ncbi:nucleotidyltransferase family protein [Nocardioides korecus]
MATTEQGDGRGDVRGVVLAAGAGRRMGRPKILVEDWLERAVRALAANGLPVTVVIGAGPEQAQERVQAVVGVLGVPLETVEADDWDEGMGASLRAALATTAEVAALVTLVDLPDVDEAVVARLLERPVDAGTLRRAAYAGKPGHPVLLGRDHHAGVAASARGDQGARAYLQEHAVELVECGDLATGEDVDSLSEPAGS